MAASIYGPMSKAIGASTASPTRSAAFIATRDSFYIATVSETGWPYVQHRGGPPGFLRVIDDKTLGFADFRGNRQYISLGNLAKDDRASLILMDYPRRARLKIFVHVETRALGADPGSTRRSRRRVIAARPSERSSFASRRSTGTASSISRRVSPWLSSSLTFADVRDRIAALEAENKTLRERLEVTEPVS